MSHSFTAIPLTLSNAPQYHKSYFSLLNQLTSSPTLEKSHFLSVLNDVLRHTRIFVILDQDEDGNSVVVGSASVLIEQKLIKNACKVGHLEDVVVHEKYRKLGLGLILVEACKEQAKKEGCMKIILDCGEKNVAFYERCGFVKSGIEMKCEF